MSDTETIPAATVVIFRRAASGGPPELLLAERSRSLSFAGGMTVFPGGRIDSADRSFAATLPGKPEEAAARVAAIRETLDETGLAIALAAPVTAAEAERARRQLESEGALGPVLARNGWQLDLDALVPFARWHPRFAQSRSFDTRFYLYDLGTGAVEIAPDGSENTRLFWRSAADALAAADRGELSVIYPTRRNLERLAGFDAFEAAITDARRYPIRTITPEPVERDGATWLTIPDDLGYPVTAERMERALRG